MTWLTEIEADDPLTGEMVLWCGPRIEADSWEEAQEKIDHIKGCRLLGVLRHEENFDKIEYVWLS